MTPIIRKRIVNASKVNIKNWLDLRKPSQPKILIDNDGNVCDQELLGGKKIIGKIDKNKLIITEARIGFSASLSEGEYTKTDEKLPTAEELKYTSFAASAEKHKDEAPKGVTTLSPKFYELIEKQGKGWK